MLRGIFEQYLKLTQQAVNHHARLIHLRKVCDMGSMGITAQVIKDRLRLSELETDVARLEEERRSLEGERERKVSCPPIANITSADASHQKIKYVCELCDIERWIVPKEFADARCEKCHQNVFLKVRG